MIEAGAWGLIAESSLILGAILSFTGWIRDQPLRLVTAFGAGVLISAVAYDLVGEAVLKTATGTSVAAGFVLGSLVFYGITSLVERWSSRRSQGTGILIGAALDAIPTAVVLGVTLLAGGGVSVAVLVAVSFRTCPRAYPPRPGSRRQVMAGARSSAHGSSSSPSAAWSLQSATGGSAGQAMT